MRKLIRDVQEARGSNYQLWAEVTRCQNPSDMISVSFSSVWTGSKNPEAPQSKGQFFLHIDDVDSLIDMLQDARNL
jgi:hypothetical protein